MIKIYCAVLLFVLLGCSSNQGNTGNNNEEIVAQTPVTITRISIGTLTDFVEFNAISTYLISSYIRSSATAYVQQVNVKPGQIVKSGQVLFVLQTKEARALGNTINALDPSFNFSGIITIKATKPGYVTSVDHQAGDYVQDGEQLAVEADVAGFGFLLNLPYEMHSLLPTNGKVEIELPDGKNISGTVTRIMPSVDSVSQSQQVFIKVIPALSIPQNLVAKINLVKQQATSAISIPKEAVLTDETQQQFWVMKLIDSTTAVKVPVTKGIESDKRVQIVQPAFTPEDKFVLTGNYGLPDTARVSIVR